MSQVGSEYGQVGEGPIPPNYEVLVACMDMVNEALARVPFERGDSPFVIVDYGTANGLVSMGLMKHCVDLVKNKYGDDQAVCVVYEDQLGNDFNKLFDNVLGGQFVASIPGYVDGNYPFYQPATHKSNLFERLSHFWRLAKDKGTITEEEYQKASFVWHFGCEEFFKEPISKADSVVSLAGMRLVRIKSATTTSPLSNLWAGQKTGDDAMAREKYGEQFSRLIRQFSQGMFREALSDERSEEEKEAVLCDLYATFAKDVALSPGEYTTAAPHYVLHFEKEN